MKKKQYIPMKGQTANNEHRRDTIKHKTTQTMIQVITKMFTKLSLILQTAQGWMIALGVFLAEYFFADHATVVWLVLTATLLDAVWGIAVSISHGQFTLSELMRLTVAKIAVYGCALAVFIGLDKVTGTELSTDIVGGAIILCETWSMLGSMLIIYPHIPVLQLLKKALTGEIANKLRISPEEVEEVLTPKSDDTKAETTEK